MLEKNSLKLPKGSQCRKLQKSIWSGPYITMWIKGENAMLQHIKTQEYYGPVHLNRLKLGYLEKGHFSITDDELELSEEEEIEKSDTEDHSPGEIEKSDTEDHSPVTLFDRDSQTDECGDNEGRPTQVSMEKASEINNKSTKQVSKGDYLEPVMKSGERSEKKNKREEENKEKNKREEENKEKNGREEKNKKSNMNKGGRIKRNVTRAQGQLPPGMHYVYKITDSFYERSEEVLLQSVLAIIYKTHLRKAFHYSK